MHEALESALDAAFESLLKGDLGSVVATYAATESILADLRVTDEVVAQRLQTKAARNAACLMAAARGVRAARRRMEEIGPNARSETYDRQGRKSSIAVPRHDLAERI